MRLVKLFVFLFFIRVLAAGAEPAHLLPFQLGSFKTTTVQAEEAIDDSVASEKAEYVGPGGARVSVRIERLPQDAKAYERLSLLAATIGAQITTDYGTAGFVRDNEIAFFKGQHFVVVSNVRGDSANMAAVARDISNSLDKGEADIPVLIKHLPNSEEAVKNAVFLHSFSNLDSLGLQQGVLSAVDSQGDADAALGTYGRTKVLIVEFHTPQLAADNDKQIITRIQELWKLGEPAPTAYRRVGNYSVFVFDAPDEQTAKQLIDQVKYEQVVQWLGDNPNILKEAEKQYINTTLGVLVAVLKASGYALLACLGIGGLAGALLFSHRRSQRTGEAIFSDAGGMLRLNLDEMTPETDPARLLRDRN